MIKNDINEMTDDQLREAIHRKSLERLYKDTHSDKKVFWMFVAIGLIGALIGALAISNVGN